MSWMGGWFDPELEDLFHDEPELLETAQRVRASRPRVEADPRFQNRLRAQLVAEASRGRGALGVRRRWRLGPAGFAWGGAFVGAALITATVFTFVSNSTQSQTVTAFSQLTAQHSVSPDQVITVAFNQPMNEQLVVAGVHIQPAVKFSPSWKGNNLVIKPLYHLAANTAYTVTIAKTAIRAASGASAAAPINISFGTAPTPTPIPAAPPTLVPVTLGTNGTGGSLLYAPDGSTLLSTVGVVPGSPTASPSASASPSPTPTPANSTPTPEGGTSQTPDVPGGLVEFPSSGTATSIGSSPSAIAYSPNGGRYLAMALDDGNGGSRIVTSLSNGTQHAKLIDSPSPVTSLTWATNDRIIYSDGTTIDSVDLSHRTAVLYKLRPGSGTITELAPGGAYAYVSPATGTGGALLNVTSEAEQILRGAADDVAFSGDGATVAWVDSSAQPARLFTEPVAQNAATPVSMPDETASPSDVALDYRGDEITYISTGSTGVTDLVVAQLANGTPMAVTQVSNTSQLTLSPAGDEVAFVSTTAAGATIEQAAVPGAAGIHFSGPRIPDGANDTLQSFVQAQVGSNGQPDLATMAALSTATANAAANTPQNLSRAYVISAYVKAQGVVQASVELIVDPDAQHTNARVASETVLLELSPTGYLVSSVDTSALRDESAGPHVVQVTSSTANGVTTLLVTFDSDLNPGTVATAISATSGSGTTLASTTAYNADTRTATVTIANAPAGTLTLDIATTLADVEGQALANSFDTTFAVSS
jgi:hypothetical protein